MANNRYHNNSRNHGWWDNCLVGGGLRLSRVLSRIPEKLALIHSEVSEALEDYREGRMETALVLVGDKPVGFPTELADVVIRCYDLAGALGLDLDAEIDRKHAYNVTRPHRHGGKKC